MIECLHQTDEILVLDKPAGLPVQPGEGVRTCLVDAVERDYGFRPYLVHRLDKETSGLIIVARDQRAASRWTRAIASREVGKFYRAVAAGQPSGSKGRFTEPVRVRGESLEADTGWRLIGSFPLPAADGAEPPLACALSYLELELGSGRTHQIRLHLAQAGLPILGDDRHGDFPLNKALRKSMGLKRLLLHARRLVLPDGASVAAPMPEHFVAFLAACAGAPDPEAA